MRAGRRGTSSAVRATPSGGIAPMGGGPRRLSSGLRLTGLLWWISFLRAVVLGSRAGAEEGLARASVNVRWSRRSERRADVYVRGSQPPPWARLLDAPAIVVRFGKVLPAFVSLKDRIRETTDPPRLVGAAPWDVRPPAPTTQDEQVSCRPSRVDGDRNCAESRPVIPGPRFGDATRRQRGSCARHSV